MNGPALLMADPENGCRNRQENQDENSGGVRPTVGTAMVGMLGHGGSPVIDARVF